MHLLAPFSKPKSHEDLFLEHYDWLAQWALQLSRGRREEATDLVHDLYVQLVRTRPDVDHADVDRVRGYLYTMLRNLSVSKARRAGRDALSSLLIVDYESVEFGLACIDRSKLILVRSDLARICEYACIRRDSSRSASVLILRFFLGYYPSEIARILQVTRAAVEKHLQAARQEARVYLERPGVLRFLGQDITLASLSSSFLPDDPIALFAELRRRIFVGVKGVCVEESAIEGRYSQESSSMNTPEFAHVVSCVRCLELTNRVLGLGPLANRFPSDTINRDGDGNEPPGPSGSGLGLDLLEKKARQSYEHVPMKLQVAVDGEVRAAQRVSSNRNELQVKLEPLGKPAFLEVLSEQGIRLAYLQIEDSVGEPQSYVTTAELSDGRFVELKLSFVSGELVVSAYYYDPLQEEIRAEIESQFLAARSADIPTSSNAPQSSLRVVARRIGRLIHSWFSSFDSLWPLGLAMATAGLLLFGLGLWSKKPIPSTLPTATALLARAQQIEQAKMSGGAAIHSTFSLETRSQDGKLLASQTVDSWRSLKPHRSALRLLDTKGRVIAGHWGDDTGKASSYTQKSGLRAEVMSPSSTAIDFDDAWELAPVGEAVSVIAGTDDRLTVRQDRDEYEIAYGPSQQFAGAGVSSATLVLDSSELRPIREAVTIKHDGSTREYRFQQLTYEVVPANQIVESDFVPGSELVGLRTGIGRIGTGEQGSLLMLAALRLLNDFGSDVEQMIDIERLPDGRVEVSGVLPTESQKTSIERVFRSLGTDAQLKLALHSREAPQTVAAQPSPSGRAETIEQVAINDSTIPMDKDLRSALSSQGISPQDLETHVHQLADNAIDHGAVIRREAWNIRQLATRNFSSRDLQVMSTENKMMWLTLLHKHIETLDRHLATLDGFLSPLFDQGNTVAAPSEIDVSAITDTGALAEATDQLSRDCQLLDELLQSQLSVSPSSPSQPANPSDLAKLIAAIRSREETLNATVERLSQLGRASLAK